MKITFYFCISEFGQDKYPQREHQLWQKQQEFDQPVPLSENLSAVDADVIDDVVDDGLVASTAAAASAEGAAQLPLAAVDAAVIMVLAFEVGFAAKVDVDVVATVAVAVDVAVIDVVDAAAVLVVVAGVAIVVVAVIVVGVEGAAAGVGVLGLLLK